MEISKRISVHIAASVCELCGQLLPVCRVIAQVNDVPASQVAEWLHISELNEYGTVRVPTEGHS